MWLSGQHYLSSPARLVELCWNILPHWLWFSSYIRIYSYVGICSDFRNKDGKIIQCVKQLHCATARFTSACDATSCIKNRFTTQILCHPRTVIVVSVWGHSVWVSNSMCTVLYCTVQLACLKMLFLFFFSCEQRKSWRVQAPSCVHSLFKRQRWLTLTKDVFLMICLDVQVELTLQSDMDHWVYRGLSELTSEDLSPSLCIALPFCLPQIKSKRALLAWMEAGKMLSSIFLLNNIIQ